MAARGGSRSRSPRNVAETPAGSESQSVSKGAPSGRPEGWKPKGFYADRADAAYRKAQDEAKSEILGLIQILMTRRRITKAELAEKMGLSEAAVRHRLNGRTEFGVYELVGLARLFDVPVQAFFDPDTNAQVFMSNRGTSRD